MGLFDSYGGLANYSRDPLYDSLVHPSMRSNFYNQYTAQASGLGGQTVDPLLSGFSRYNQADGGFFGSGGFNLGSIKDIASIGLGVGQLFTGFQNYKLAKEQLNLAKQDFAFQKGLANRNLANQAKLINTQYDNAAQVAAGMAGGSFGMVDPNIVKQYEKKAKEHHVSGAPIK